jgi:citrate synthase
MAWLTAVEALAVLGVQQQTLYANVTRGRVRAKRDPKNTRRSLYNSEDIERLSAKRAGRRPAAAIAAAAISWGDPVLASGISTASCGRLWYRGRDAIDLAATMTFEDCAAHLWDTSKVEFNLKPVKTQPAPSSTPLQRALWVLAKRAGVEPPTLGRAVSLRLVDAAALVADIAAAMAELAPQSSGALHTRLSIAWRRPQAEDLLRRTLVLLADHELNASTFAARVAASSGASLSASVLAALVTLSGPRHGGAAAAIGLLANTARQIGATEAVRGWLDQGRHLPGFGHPLYAEGDPRAIAMLAQFKPHPLFDKLGSAAEELTGELPNVDFALAAMADAYSLPPESAFVLFTVARSVGWIAHILEQTATGALIRPRARYTGPPLTS